MPFPLRPDIDAGIDDAFMRRAIELASRGLGRTAPNPAVGAVVVRDDRVVGEGFHPQAGQPHAEVFALASAGEAAHGATMYVTLEPCAHHGKTPPCTDAIIAAGIARVVIGLPDTTPDAQGGAAKLMEAGIEVFWAEDPVPFEWLVEGWHHRLVTGRPFVRAKAAASLDGHLSFSEGEPAAITGPWGYELTMAIRDAADVVLVGASTVIADDPALTIREPNGTRTEHQPTRVVLCRGRVPSPTSQVFTDHAAPTIVLASNETDETLLAKLPDHVIIERFDNAGGLCAALEALGRRGVNDVLVEPGPMLMTSLWDGGLIGELTTVIAGGMAGVSAPPAYLGDADREGDDLKRLATPRYATILGDVAVIAWRPVAGQ